MRSHRFALSFVLSIGFAAILLGCTRRQDLGDRRPGGDVNGTDAGTGSTIRTGAGTDGPPDDRTGGTAGGGEGLLTANELCDRSIRAACEYMVRCETDCTECEPGTFTVDNCFSANRPMCCEDVDCNATVTQFTQSDVLACELWIEASICGEVESTLAGSPCDGLLPQAAEPSGPPAAAKRIFVTSGSFNGALGGIQGADAKCQLAADGAELGGRFVAWLSTFDASAIDRIADVGPWYDLEGRVVFRNRAQLGSTPEVAMEVDEHRERVYDWVWTATSTGGTRSGVSGSDYCDEWFTDSSYDPFSMRRIAAMAGVTHERAGWTQTDRLECGNTARLYCIEQ